MSDKQLPSLGDNSFEGLKRTNAQGAEYWSARDLQPLLGYSQWRRFEQAVERAITPCKQSGNNPSHHFAGAGKPITGGKGLLRLRGRTFHLAVANMQNWPLRQIHNYNHAQR